MLQRRKAATSPSIKPGAIACAAFGVGALAAISCLTSVPTPRPTTPAAASSQGAIHPRDASSAGPISSGAAGTASWTLPQSRMCGDSRSSAPPPRLAAPPAASASTTPLPARPPTIRCGDVDCDAKTLVCCQINGSLDAAAAGSPQPERKKPACARRTALEAGARGSEFAETPWYRQQSQVCGRALSDSSSLISVTYCDDSSDCPAGQVCSRTHGTCGALTASCSDWFYADTCEPIETMPVERCVPGAACRTPGTACFGGECVLSETPRSCGTRTCPAGTVCCWRREQCYECVARDECGLGPGATQECFGSQDCPAPRRCRAVFEYSTAGGKYYLGSSCEKGEGELCTTIDDCLAEVDGLRLKDCSYARLGSDDGTGEPNSPLLGSCVYGN